MIKFYNYIFSKGYFLCSNFLKEKEFPATWSGLIVGFMMFINVIIVLDFIQYEWLPEIVKFNNKYYKFFAVAWVGIVMVWVNYKNRYLKILNEYTRYSNTLKKVFRVLSILYYLLLAYGFFYMGELGRNYNLLHN